MIIPISQMRKDRLRVVQSLFLVAQLLRGHAGDLNLVTVQLQSPCFRAYAIGGWCVCVWGGGSSLYNLDLRSPLCNSLLKTPSLQCWRSLSSSPWGPLLCSVLWQSLGRLHRGVGINVNASGASS